MCGRVCFFGVGPPDRNFMADERMQDLRQELDTVTRRVDVNYLRQLMSRPQRQRLDILAFEDILMDVKRTRGWTDMSIMPSCLLHPIACDVCLAERHAVTMMGYDPYCPCANNTRGPCFWAFEEYDGRCESCYLRDSFGCGWGDHSCADCAYSSHNTEITAFECNRCGPCNHTTCVANEDYHCVMVCDHGPFHQVCG